MAYIIIEVEKTDRRFQLCVFASQPAGSSAKVRNRTRAFIVLEREESRESVKETNALLAISMSPYQSHTETSPSLW